jgi:hypothetical protein
VERESSANCDREVATDRWASTTESRKGEIGCGFDEIQNLVELIERRDMDGSAGRSEAGAGASRTGVASLGRRCRARAG